MRAQRARLVRCPEKRGNSILHVRYNDDFRLFLRDEESGQEALVLLARLLRRKGLSLQSAKSFIEDASTARGRVDGLAPVLQGVQKQWNAQMLIFMGISDDDPYPSLVEIDTALADNPDDAPIEVIRAAFRQFFVSPNRPAFDKSLFSYLLKRLGLAKDRIAVRHVVRFLSDNPEQTTTILTYLGQLEAFDEFEPQLAGFLRSRQGRVYLHQAYQVLRWAVRVSPDALNELLLVARHYSFYAAGPKHLRAIARTLLGRYGNPADLERLRDVYDTTVDPLERAQIVCSLSGMEKGERNAFFARVRGDGALVATAVEWSKRHAGE